MPDYDFRSLSSYDFEIFVRDLLQKTLGVRLQSFKTGRDKGIDLRYSRTWKNDIIVQCKHYANSNITTLLRELASKEKNKLKKLRHRPKRYVLATSLGLTPPNKDELFLTMRPFVKTTGDIVGKEDLNNSLADYPEIERKNFKLWLTSTSVLERIVHSSAFNRSEASLESIKRKLRLYVQNESFRESIKILEKFNVCIVSGIPGIGKTMLAEILTIHFMDHGYEAYFVGNNIEEALQVYNRDSKQVFYYDDFLGQTALGPQLAKNEDKDLLRLFDTFAASKTHKLILTTREYILNQAKQRFERLASANLDLKKCIIDLSKYTTQAKAKILFNHLYFSELSDLAISDLLHEKQYWQLINHRNYSPRIVEWMTVFFKETGSDQGTYFKTFLANLDNPERLWKHAFENQLSNQARYVLITLSSLPQSALLTDAETAFKSHYTTQARKYNFQTTQQDFQRALKEVENTFVSTELIGTDYEIKFHNPSIRDFLRSYLIENPIACSELLRDCVFFTQVIDLWGYNSQDSNTEALRKTLLRYQDLLAERIRVLFQSEECTIFRYSWGQDRQRATGRMERSLLQRLAFAIDVYDMAQSELLKEMVREVIDLFVAHPLEQNIREFYLVKIIQYLSAHEYDLVTDRRRFLDAIKTLLGEDLGLLDGFEHVMNVLAAEPDMFTVDERGRLAEDFDSRHLEIVDRYIHSTTSSEDIKSYGQRLDRVAQFLEISSKDALSRIDERIEELPHEDDQEDDSDNEYGREENPDGSEMKNVEHMFELLAGSERDTT